ncbi:PREDICTED: pentatricopeptide repeat-containing protein At4g01030, mitochondrial [Lupinus angustifolius]|uniref:pentatricopeptide repeat-containing protein At4g01030, mitochondrial n=1 Tax=Lupinus angustifolius TaxID=3871 RepID=UPI00092E84F2|nr:PREDICTED: pentatricopeptide repeat-containing protein At4g01030, mitochondrial [Lupinus angustifolius]
MAKLSPFLHLTPHSLHNPQTHMPLRTHSPPSILYVISDTKHLHSTSFSSSKLSLSILDSLGELRTLNSVRELHAQMLKLPKNGNLATMDASLIRYYLEFGDFVSAIEVFFVGFTRNYLIWNSFLEEFASFRGNPNEILKVFKELSRKGVNFDSKALTVVLKICLALMDLWVGLEIHACLIKRGFHFDVHLSCALINLYEKCWGIDKANQVFHETPYQEDFLWNTVLIANLRSERWWNALELFRGMQLSSAKATGGTIVKMMQACGKLRALNEGKQIHGYVLRFGLVSNISISNSIISMYSRNSRLRLARAVFDSMEDHNLSSWNSIISSYAVDGCLNEAWDMFQEMESSSIKPDIITWNSLLSGHFLQGSYEMVLSNFRNLQSAGFKPDSCSVTSALQAVIELDLFNYGKEIHGYIIRNKLDYDVYVCTSLVDMYIKNDRLDKAQAVFHHTKNKNVCAWNSLISGYCFKGLFSNAETLLNQMEKEGIKHDLVTWNSLVSGYSMWGRSEEALAVINRMKSLGFTPNVVSWTAMISGCSQNEKYRDALQFFIQMQEENVKPNSTTICSLLRACSGPSLLKKGEEIHCFSIRLGFVDDIYLATALIDMYSKGGKLKVAHEVFNGIREKTLPCWNCILMGYALHGHGEEVMILFDNMCKTGIRPDAITFTALLSGCKSSGLVDEGWKYFDSMKTDYNIIPTIEHYSCMVDLLGKAGFLDEAVDFIQNMPVKPDASIWGALLACCRIHKDIKLAEIAARKLFKLEPYNSANYVLMMNIYSSLNRWDDVERLKDKMTALGIKSPHVWSWTQVNQSVHVFSTEGKSHPEEGEIYFELYQLISEIRMLGYIPDINCVYQNIDDKEKEKVLLSHTEKLAMAYGLMKTQSGSPIRVVKNTRICHDCHTAAKYISLARNREIFLRDGGRFHHFMNGQCSCNDCW